MTCAARAHVARRKAPAASRQDADTQSLRRPARHPLRFGGEEEPIGRTRIGAAATMTLAQASWSRIEHDARDALPQAGLGTIFCTNRWPMQPGGPCSALTERPELLPPRRQSARACATASSASSLDAPERGQSRLNTGRAFRGRQANPKKIKLIPRKFKRLAGHARLAPKA